MNNKLEIEELKKINKYTKRNIKKIENGYPIQYVIGYVNFYGNTIFVNKNVLIPRYETEYLIELLLKYIKKYKIDNPKILDLCTGSGCIGITLKKELISDVTISDISRKALKVAKKNIRYNNADIKVIKSDLFNNINDKYDIIITNPPYVIAGEELPKEVKYEPEIALFSGDKGINHIRHIIENSNEYLNEKGILAIEINEKSESDLKLIVDKYYDNYLFIKDLAGKTRYLFIFKNLN